MKKLFLLLIAAPLAAQTLTGLKIADDEDSNPDLTAGCVTFQIDVASIGGEVDTSVEEGTTNSLGNTIGECTAASQGCAAADDQYYFQVCHGTPSTTHFYRINFGSSNTDCPTGVTCTNCGSSDHPLFADDSGLNCPIDEEPFTVAHPAAGSPDVTGPTITDLNPYDDCDADETPTSTTCANLASDLETLAGTTGTHQVELPPGTCSLTSEFTLPSLTSADRICIRPELPDEDLRPTPLVQTHPGYLPTQVVFEFAAPYERANTNLVSIMEVPDNYTLTDIVVRDVPEVPNPVQATVTGFTEGTTSTLTLGGGTCPNGFVNTALVVLDLPGADTYPAYGTISSCSSGSLVVTSAQNFTGSLSSNGTATLGSVPISTCSGEPIQCTTAVPHGLPTGTFTALDTIYVFGVEGETGANGRWTSFSVVDSDTFELTGSTSEGAYVASDYDFVRMQSHPALSVIRAFTSEGVRLGRITTGNPGPTYMGYGNSVDFYGATSVLVRDSILHANSASCPVQSSGLTNCANYGTRSGDYVRGDGARDLAIVNNLLAGSGGTAGLNFQNQQRTVHDLLIQGNHLLNTNRPFQDVGSNNYFPGSMGYYQENRHCIELKAACYNCLLDRNLFDTMGNGFAGRLGYCIALFTTQNISNPSGAYRQQDVEVSNNIFRNIGTAVAVGTQAPIPTVDNNRFHRRIYIHDNWIEGAGHELRLQPQDQGTATATSSASGAQISVRTGTDQFRFVNNTIFRATGLWAPALFNYQGDKVPGCQIDGNIFLYHRNASADEGFVRFGPSFSDFDETSNLTEFDKLCPNGSFANNLIVAGVENPNNVSALKDSSSDADTVTASEMASAWPTSGSFSTLDLGPDDSTYSARVAAVWGGDKTPEAAYLGHGVSDPAALIAGVFGPTGLSVLYQPSITVPCPIGGCLSFTWTAPTSTACTVRISDDGWTAAAQSATDASSLTAQTVTFTNIGSGDWEAFVECPNYKPLDWTKTLGP